MFDNFKNKVEELWELPEGPSKSERYRWSTSNRKLLQELKLVISQLRKDVLKKYKEKI